MSAGPGDAERLPWLEPYREPVTRAPPPKRGRRGGMMALAIVGVTCAVGGAFWLGQQRAAPTQVAAPVRPAIEQPEPVRMAAADPAPLTAEAVPPSEDATAPIAMPKPKAVKSAASGVRVHRGTAAARKVQDRPLEHGQLANVLDKQGEKRTWPMMPSPGPAGQVIQLGAFTTPTKAQRAYARRTQRYPLLAGMPKVIVPVATKPRGQVLYVLRLGTQTPEQATIVCRNLKNSGDHCLVIG